VVLSAEQYSDSDGVGVLVYVNGNLKYSVTITPDTALWYPFSFVVKNIDLEPGTVVDFAVTPGPAFNTDGDHLTAFITINVPRNSSSFPAWVTNPGSCSSRLTSWLSTLSFLFQW